MWCVWSDQHSAHTQLNNDDSGLLMTIAKAKFIVPLGPCILLALVQPRVLGAAECGLSFSTWGIWLWPPSGPSPGVRVCRKAWLRISFDLQNPRSFKDLTSPWRLCIGKCRLILGKGGNKTMFVFYLCFIRYSFLLGASNCDSYDKYFIHLASICIWLTHLLYLISYVTLGNLFRIFGPHFPHL